MKKEKQRKGERLHLWAGQSKQSVSECSGKHKGLKAARLRRGKCASFKTEEEANLTLTSPVFAKTSFPSRALDEKNLLLNYSGVTGTWELQKARFWDSGMLLPIRISWFYFLLEKIIWFYFYFFEPWTSNGLSAYLNSTDF